MRAVLSQLASRASAAPVASSLGAELRSTWGVASRGSLEPGLSLAPRTALPGGSCTRRQTDNAVPRPAGGGKDPHGWLAAGGGGASCSGRWHGARHTSQGPPMQQAGATSFQRGFRTSAPLHKKQRDYYEVLGVAKDASAGDIKKAYYKVAKQYHPDQNKGDKEAEQKFLEAQKAYETLNDAEKRPIYDQLGPEGMDQYEQGGGGGGGGEGPFGGGGGGGGFSGGFRTGPGQQVDMEDIFQQFFGGKAYQPRRGPDLQVQLDITFMEAMKGCSRTINVPDESGKPRSVEVAIPQGVDSGMRLQMQGQGGKGTKGLPRGHLFVNVVVRPDKRFVRDGDDVHVQTEIRIDEAALGGTIRVPTLFEGEVDLKVKPGTQAGHRMRLRGKGVPHVRGLGAGDQFVHVGVRVPSTLSARQRELLQEYGAEEEKTKSKAKA